MKLLEAKGPTLPKAGDHAGARRRSAIATPPVAGNESFCASEFQRLAMMDFDTRFRDLLRDARRENVSFYVVTPAGPAGPADAPKDS